MNGLQREENKAILECLAIIAPGVKWSPALASSFERMLLKRGFEIIRHTPNAIRAPKDEEDANGHVWKQMRTIVMCAKCGWRKGGKNGELPCKGSPGIALRSFEKEAP